MVGGGNIDADGEVDGENPGDSGLTGRGTYLARFNNCRNSRYSPMGGPGTYFDMGWTFCLHIGCGMYSSARPCDGDGVGDDVVCRAEHNVDVVVAFLSVCVYLLTMWGRAWIHRPPRY